FVVIAVGADRTFDVDLPPFRKILAAVLALLPPDDDVVPLGTLLLVPFRVVPRLAGRERKLADRLAAAREPHLRVLPEIPDEYDLVDRHSRASRASPDAPRPLNSPHPQSSTTPS